MVSHYKTGEKDIRPWGHWLVLDTGPFHVVKRITVLPGTRLSLQYHRHRQEIWTCVEGRGVAIIDGVETQFSPGVTVFVPPLIEHRMACTGETDMIIVETQLGDFLSEDDVVRIQDDFGR
ncbi:phosphomannose isomerase type II C-terminal cupin domain [Coralliovum pocilloporae]|uniref:phosphomannose isomerase type II C-terminal cupin domain n=1 Tax=Coralliovum pocilloporae TaxID=3066369 RepID=UPI003307AE11